MTSATDERHTDELEHLGAKLADIAADLRRLADGVERHVRWLGHVGPDPSRSFADVVVAVQHDVLGALPSLGLERLVTLARDADAAAASTDRPGS